MQMFQISNFLVNINAMSTRIAKWAGFNNHISNVRVILPPFRNIYWYIRHIFLR